MKRPQKEAKHIDDDAARTETGRTMTEWFQLIDAAGAVGRAAVGKYLLGHKVDAWWISTLTVEYEAARGIFEKDGRPKGYSVCSTKTLAASPDRVFEALTASRDLAKWFGPDATMDPRVAGQLVDKDGVRATIRKLRPGKALVLSWETPGLAENSEVEVLVQPKGAGTGVVVNHTRVAARHDADMVRAAWEAQLTQLKLFLEA